MKCLRCEQTEMVLSLTKQGVEIDVCPECGGVWLDQGELFYFTKRPKELQKELNEAIKRGERSDRICPKTGDGMLALRLFNGDLALDYSSGSGGIWF